MKNKTKIIIGFSIVTIALLSIRNWSYNNHKSIENPDITSNFHLKTKPLISELKFIAIFYIDP